MDNVTDTTNTVECCIRFKSILFKRTFANKNTGWRV